MKKRTINVILSVVSILFAFSLFAFGVYAANSATSSVSNTFYFDIPSDKFFVEINGSITGCRNEENYANFLTHDKLSDMFDRAGEIAYRNRYQVEFVEDGNSGYKDIVFRFKIKNFNDYAIKAEIRSNYNPVSTPKFSNTPSEAVTLQKREWNEQTNSWVTDEKEITVTMRLLTTENFVDEPNSFTIHFELV